ncbi:Phorbol-ester/DAG-type domain-containing protein [Entamoeba marina]
MADNDNSEDQKTGKTKKLYTRGAFGKTIREYLKANGDENCTDETVDYIEQVMLEFVIEFTLKMREDDPQKQIKPEDILVHLIRDRRKFDRASYILCKKEQSDAFRSQGQPKDSAKIFKAMNPQEFFYFFMCSYESDGDDQLQGMQLICSENFDEDDYEDYELADIYRQGFFDHIEETKTIQSVYTKKLDDAHESIKELLLREQKYKQHISMSKEIIQELKEVADRNSQKYMEMCETYENEQKLHNKTIEELNELKNASSSMCANTTLCGSIQIVVKNGKISELKLQESEDSARDDALLQVSLLTKQISELQRSTNSMNLEMNKAKEETEKEKQNSVEYKRKLDELSNDLHVLETGSKYKDDRIKELTKQIEELQQREKRSTNAEDRIKRLLEKRTQTQQTRTAERKKRMGIGLNHTNKSPLLISPSVNEKQDEKPSLITNALMQFSNTLFNDPKQTTLYNKRRSSFLENKSEDNPSSQTGSKPTSNLMSSRSSMIEPPTQQSQVLEKTSSVSAIERKHKKTPSWNPEYVSDNSVVLEKPGLVDIAMNTNGTTVVSCQNGMHCIEMYTRETWHRTFKLDKSINRILKTPKGFCVVDDYSVTLFEEAPMEYPVTNVTAIGESVNGILVVDKDMNLYDISDSDFNVRAPLKVEVQDRIFGLIDCYITKVNDKLTSILKLTHEVKTIDKRVISFTISDDLIWAIDKDTPEHILCFDSSLSLLETKTLLYPMSHIEGYGGFVLTYGGHSAYIITPQKKIVDIINPTFDEIKGISFTLDKKSIVAILATQNNIIRTQTKFATHEWRDITIKQATCAVCGKRATKEKGKKCKKCSLFIHSNCVHSYGGILRTTRYPCFSSN